MTCMYSIAAFAEFLSYKPTRRLTEVARQLWMDFANERADIFDEIDVEYAIINLRKFNVSTYEL